MTRGDDRPGAGTGADEPPSVVAFTDTYLPTVNGVTYAVQTWRDQWRARGGRMAVVYPNSAHDPAPGEHPVPSVRFPFYEGFRVGTPLIPDDLGQADVVHSHTPFGLGVAGRRYAGRADAALVVSYHTPSAEYAEYLSPFESVSRVIRRASRRYERWFLDAADVVVTPTAATRERLQGAVGPSAPVEVVPNGVDTDFFRPVDPRPFLERYDLPRDRPLVGYTGRHGYEKRLTDLVDAAPRLDGVTVVLAGDGPAREDLEARADAGDGDVRFLGFLDRTDLPAFYSALDVFAFPSPVETEGLVALEAAACGTPVAGADEGALANTVVPGENGRHFDTGDSASLAQTVRRVLGERRSLTRRCLARREEMDVSRSIDRLEAVYRRALESAED